MNEVQKVAQDQTASEIKIPQPDYKDKKWDNPAVLSGTPVTKEDMERHTLEYFNGEELPANVFLSKYALKDTKGNIYENSPDDMHRRMAREFGRMEYEMTKNLNLNGSFKALSQYGQTRQALTTERIYDYFKDFKYIVPQGSVMMALGNEFMFASLSNCIVLPEIYDSYGGICYADQQLAQLYKRRCGAGAELSSLRPADMSVNNAAGTTTGVASFMERYSNTTREVAQNGRRGALMLTLDVAHPDAEQFTTVKQDLSKVTGANISLRLSDEFMQAVKDNGSYTHRWPIKAEVPKMTKTIQAQDLWNTIISCAHNTAEPGLIFWDRQHWYSTSSVYPQYENISTNPCAEIAMGADSCRLFANNMYSCVVNPFTPEAYFDYEKWYEVNYEAQRLMDDLVELELEAIQRILDKIKSDDQPDHIKAVELRTWELLYKVGKEGRRTGLGYTGHADALAALGLKYDGDAAIEATDAIMKEKCRAEFDSSIDMSIERGAFVGFDPKIENTSEFVQMLEKELPTVYTRMMVHGRRNVSISTVAPTGSLSILTQTSSGIEPVYMVHYQRNKKVNPSDKDVRVDYVDELGDSWQTFDVYHPKVKVWMDATGETDLTKSPYHGATAPEIDWVKRVKMQSTVQKYITHSISSTINLPADVAVEKVGEIYLEAWKMGLKGVTVYRDGSRGLGVLTATDSEVKSDFVETTAPKRPKVLECNVMRFQNKWDKWIGFVGIYEDRPYEVFTGLSEAFVIPYYVEQGQIRRSKDETGSKYDFIYYDRDGNEIVIENLHKAFSDEYWNYAKLISGILRHGMPMPYVIDLVMGLNLNDDVITTWKNGIIRMLKKYIKDGTAAADKKCKNCDTEDSVIYQEGCLLCTSCGSSKCG